MARLMSVRPSRFVVHAALAAMITGQVVLFGLVMLGVGAAFGWLAMMIK